MEQLRRGVLVVLDGLEDIAYPSLDNKTPYNYGKEEHFRQVEAAGATGRLATTPAGFEPDTQTCVLTMLGVAPKDIPTGRSYIEALAIGMPVDDEDLVMRCNFVKISADGRLEIPTCEPPEEVAAALLAEVRSLPDMTVTRVGPYKSLQCIAGEKGSLEGLVTFPPHNYTGEPLEQLLPSGNPLADRLADFSREMLKKYAPYTVFNWAQSVKGELPRFTDLHGGISGGMVSATDAPVGGAVAMGMECIRPATATGDTDTDLAAKVEATLDLLGRHQVVMLHVGGPDEATHRMDEREKAAFVEKMDRELIGPLLAGISGGTRLMVTCDHMALCGTSGHTADPVIFYLCEKGSVLCGNRGVIPGNDCVKLLLEDLDKA